MGTQPSRLQRLAGVEAGGARPLQCEHVRGSGTVVPLLKTRSSRVELAPNADLEGEVVYAHWLFPK
jgi:hypothetical protein